MLNMSMHKSNIVYVHVHACTCMYMNKFNLKWQSKQVIQTLLCLQAEYNLKYFVRTFY